MTSRKALPAARSTALAQVDKLPLRSIDDLQAIGEVFVRSGLFADTRDAAKAMVKILAGRELGLPPFASMTGVNLIQGKAALGSNLIASVIQRSGTHRFTVTKMTDTEVAIAFFERVDGAWVSCGPDSIFTHQDAIKAGLFAKETYRKYPRNMLYARALSNGARWYCAGVFGGPVYVPEELGAVVDEDECVVSSEVIEPQDDGARDAVRAGENDGGILAQVFVDAVHLLDGGFASWRHRPTWCNKFFGEPITDEEALREFAEREPTRFVEGVAAMRAQR